MIKRQCLSSTISLSISAVVLAWCQATFADAGATAKPPAAPASGSLDEQLLKGLDNQLLDDLHEKPNAKPNSQPAPTSLDDRPTKSPAPREKKLGEKSTEQAGDKASAKPLPATKPESSDEKPPETPGSLEAMLRESLSNDLSSGEDVGSAGEDPNPLKRIGIKMRSVAERLGQRDSRERTQRQQQQIVAELASLVKQLAEQQQQSPSSGSKKTSSTRTKVQQPQPGNSAGPDSDQPAHDSSNGVRKPRVDRPDPAANRQLVEKAIDRLNLPAKDREEMLQAPPDEFLPGYEAAIRRYFERLVESESNNP